MFLGQSEKFKHHSVTEHHVMGGSNDLSNVLVAERSQILTDTLQHRGENLPRILEVIISSKEGTKSGMGWSSSTYRCDGQVSRYFWHMLCKFGSRSSISGASGDAEPSLAGSILTYLSARLK